MGTAMKGALIWSGNTGFPPLDSVTGVTPVQVHWRGDERNAALAKTAPLGQEQTALKWSHDGIDTGR